MPRQEDFVGMKARKALPALTQWPCILNQLVGRELDDGEERAANLRGHFADFEIQRDDHGNPALRPHILDAMREACEQLLSRHGASVASSSQCTCPPLAHMHVTDRNYRRLLCGLVLLIDQETTPPLDQATKHARDLGNQDLEAHPLSRKRPRE